MATKNSGIFRPKRFVRNPNKMLPIKPPSDNKDAIHEISSMFNFPNGNGLLSDVSNVILAALHPTDAPCAIVTKFTANKILNSILIFLAHR